MTDCLKSDETSSFSSFSTSSPTTFRSLSVAIDLLSDWSRCRGPVLTPTLLCTSPAPQILNDALFTTRPRCKISKNEYQDNAIRNYWKSKMRSPIRSISQAVLGFVGQSLKLQISTSQPPTFSTFSTFSAPRSHWTSHTFQPPFPPNAGANTLSPTHV